ncbi:hypothetical protein MUK42_24282 [Musa troglodytarum]|uniref:Uncharacterized protein n=1 Tax=Musa troglodytarum TaxID=320322 RepID=A0A9E7GDB9_9LILI|nr:hypothetical protein MUK42_24282 [Musa troglodytarum]
MRRGLCRAAASTGIATWRTRECTRRRERAWRRGWRGCRRGRAPRDPATRHGGPPRCFTCC